VRQPEVPSEHLRKVAVRTKKVDVPPGVAVQPAIETVGHRFGIRHGYKNGSRPIDAPANFLKRRLKTAEVLETMVQNYGVEGSRWKGQGCRICLYKSANLARARLLKVRTDHHETGVVGWRKAPTFAPEIKYPGAIWQMI
jgi:hypothetical protein